MRASLSLKGKKEKANNSDFQNNQILFNMKVVAVV